MNAPANENDPCNQVIDDLIRIEMKRAFAIGDFCDRISEPSEAVRWLEQVAANNGAEKIDEWREEDGNWDDD